MNKKDLLKAIDMLKPVASFNAGDLTGLDSYLFFQGGRFAAFAEAAAVSVPLDVGFDAAIPADEFTKFAKKLPADEFSMTLVEGEIKIAAGLVNAGFKTADIMNSLPDLGVSGVKSWMNVPADFSDALRFCQFSVSSDVSHGVIACAFVRPDCILGSDNYRLTERTFAKKAANGFSFFIPKKMAKPLSDSVFTKAGFSDGWIHFKTEDESVISIRSIEGTYPAVDAFFDVEGDELVLPVELIPALDRATVIENDLTAKLTTIDVKKGEILCGVHGSRGWVEEKVKCDYTGPEIHFSVNPEFLKEVLPISNKFIAGQGWVLFKGENFRHAMAYVR